MNNMNGYRGRGRGPFTGGFQGGMSRGGGMGRGGGGGPRQRRQEDKDQFKKLFIGGLSFDTTSESLREHFATFGNVIDCVVMKDQKTQKPKGFGFITYQEAESVDKVQDGRPHALDGRTVDTKRAMPKEDAGKSDCKEPTKKIFLGGLSPDATEEDVRLICEEFGGPVEKVDVIKDKDTGKGRGFGFVTFSDEDKVDKIYLKGCVPICGRDVEVKKAVEKNKLNAGGDAGAGSYGRGSGGGGGGGGGGGMGGGMYGGQQQQGYSSYGGGGGYTGGQGYNSQPNYAGQQNAYGGGMGSGYEGGYSAGPVRGGGGGGGGYQQQRHSPYAATSYGGAAAGGYSSGGGSYTAGGGGGGGAAYNAGGAAYNAGGAAYNAGGAGYGARRY